MLTKSILAATLVVPLLLLACNRDEQFAMATGESQEKLAVIVPLTPEQQMLESSPPAAGTRLDFSSSPPAFDYTPTLKQRELID